MIIDTHCHLTHERLAAELDSIVERAREAGLVGCMTIGTGVEDAKAGLALAASHPKFIRCAAGIDPFTAHRLGDGFPTALSEMGELHRSHPFRAVGEIGLDYHYDLDPKPIQRQKFEAQLSLAEELDRPVVIHVREAHEDMQAVLRDHPNNRGVIHSFTSGPRDAEIYLGLGWHLSFNGVATFKNAQEVRDAAKICTMDRMLVETDAPYLAPIPKRGKRCEPAYTALTLQFLAEYLERDSDELAAVTTENARSLFSWGDGS